MNMKPTLTGGHFKRVNRGIFSGNRAGVKLGMCFVGFML